MKFAHSYAVLNVRVDAQGNVTAAELAEGTGDPDADAAAERAVQGWKFVPANDGNCKAVTSEVQYAVPIGGGQQTFKDPCNHDAAVAVQEQPVYPNVRDLWRAVEVQTKITLDATGRVVDHKIIQSSGYDALDKAAVAAALQSGYFPAVHACRSAAGWYFFNVTFDPNA